MRSMVAAFGRRHLRLGILLAVLCGLIGTLVLGGGSPAAPSDINPPLTAAQKVVAMDALKAIAPRRGFHRYEQWEIGIGSRGPAFVSCLPEPAVCFGSTKPVHALSDASVRALLAGFGVRPTELFCPPASVPFPFGTEHCLGQGKLAKFGLGIILTATRARFADQRSGTQVIFFAYRPT
jgi:hypothetical protein